MLLFLIAEKGPRAAKISWRASLIYYGKPDRIQYTRSIAQLIAVKIVGERV